MRPGGVAASAALLLLLAAAPTAVRADADVEARIIALVNKQRTLHGLAPLAPQPTLSAVAAAHSADMATADRLSHEGSDGARLGDRLRRAGYPFRVTAENVAAGPESPDRVVDLWMASEGHRFNILMPEATEAGAAGARSPDPASRYRFYWTLVLAARLGERR